MSENADNQTTNSVVEPVVETNVDSIVETTNSTNETTNSSNSNNENVEVNDDTVEVPINDEDESHQAPKSNEDKSKKVSFMLDVESKAIIETLVDSLEGFNVENLIKLLPRLIMHVENYKNLSGENKKALVIRMLNHIIDITDCPGDDAIFDPIMKRMVPGMIDLLVEVDQGRLKLKKKNCLFKCLSGN
jgi:hypothetical protein